MQLEFWQALVYAILRKQGLTSIELATSELPYGHVFGVDIQGGGGKIQVSVMTPEQVAFESGAGMSAGVN